MANSGDSVSTGAATRPVYTIGLIKWAVIALALFALSACTLPGNVSTASDDSPNGTLSRMQKRKLEDWKIRAGLYGAKHAPSVLKYVDDAAIDDHTYAGQCRSARQELDGYTRGLLRAPTAELRRDARRIHRANLRYLRSCEKGRAVAWHHAAGAYQAATTEANADYARAAGADPTAYDAPKAFD
jgi:hypothetical protein